MYWIFADFINPLIAATFYTTEAEGRSNDVTFFRKPIWARLVLPLLRFLMLSSSSSSTLSSSSSSTLSSSSSSSLSLSLLSLLLSPSSPSSSPSLSSSSSL